jgi:hypothetical protein
LAFFESSRYLNGKRFFHALICIEPLGPIAIFDMRQHRFQAVRASPTTAQSTSTFLLIETGVDVDMDDLGMRGEGGEIAGDAIVKPGADGDQAIAFLHGVVGKALPCMPSMCRALGCVHRTRPGPAAWWCRGYFPCRPACAAAVDAPAMIAPPPTYSTGARCG